MLFGALRNMLRMKRVIFFILLILSSIRMYPQSEQWREYCHLQFIAQDAFAKGNFAKASFIYSKMDTVYGRIVDYSDMQKFCISAANVGDSVLVRKALITITGYKCFDISFFDNQVFGVYKRKNWWVLCDSLSNLYGQKNRLYMDTLRKMQVQDSILRYLYVHSTDAEVRNSVLLRMRSLDSINTIILSNLVQEFGLPTWENIGYNGFHSAYVLMMHVEDTLRNYLIDQLLPLMEDGLVPRDKMAYLIDRKLVMLKQPQRYGCQVYRGGKSQPIENIEQLNDRRETMWLPPRNIERLKTKIVNYE